MTVDSKLTELTCERNDEQRKHENAGWEETHTCELARKERHSNDARGIGISLVSVCFSPDSPELAGSFNFLPSGTLTSRLGKLTAAAAGIIVLFAKAICSKYINLIKN